jgi:hypothetical protein
MKKHSSYKETQIGREIKYELSQEDKKMIEATILQMKEEHTNDKNIENQNWREEKNGSS